jgi:hypothetical protein
VATVTATVTVLPEPESLGLGLGLRLRGSESVRVGTTDSESESRVEPAPGPSPWPGGQGLYPYVISGCHGSADYLDSDSDVPAPASHGTVTSQMLSEGFSVGLGTESPGRRRDTRHRVELQ